MSAATLVKGLLPNSVRNVLRYYLRRPRNTVSQMGQDFWVFGEAYNRMRGGYFLEVGSADGMMLSNTFLLEKRFGWRGICIEPNPVFFRALQWARKAVCLNTCIDASEHEVDFTPNGLLGGIVCSDTDNKMDQPVRRSIKLKTRTLASVLKEHGAPNVIDYFSLDAEGAEERSLADFPFTDFRFNCMTIERPKAQLRQILRENGYKVVKEIIGFDAFYVHDAFIPTYVHNVLAFWKHHG